MPGIRFPRGFGPTNKCLVTVTCSKGSQFLLLLLARQTAITMLMALQIFPFNRRAAASPIVSPSLLPSLTMQITRKTRMAGRADDARTGPRCSLRFSGALRPLQSHISGSVRGALRCGGARRESRGARALVKMRGLTKANACESPEVV